MGDASGRGRGAAERRALVAILWLALGACDSEGYDVVVRVEGLDLFARGDLYVVPHCRGIPVLGQAPASYRRRTELSLQGSAPIGGLTPGAYGLYARLSTHDCRVFAAGCRDIRVEAGGSGTLIVEARAIVPIPCPAGAQCSDGICEPRDDGPDASVDAAPEGGMDDPDAGACTPSSVEEEACGACGTRTRWCTADGSWEDWGACEGAGDCTPGQAREGNCDPCSHEVCTDACGWACALRDGNACEWLEGVNWVCCGPDAWVFCLPECQWNDECSTCDGCGC